MSGGGAKGESRATAPASARASHSSALMKAASGGTGWYAEPVAPKRPSSA